MEHLLTCLDPIRDSVTKSALVLLLLDLDGTLAPIVSTPQEAVIPEGTRATLRCLSLVPRYRVGVVSGRPVDEVREMVSIEGIFYAGNHGLELVHPQGRWTHPEAAALHPQLAQVARALEVELGHIPGLLIEHKGLTIGVHYRQVAQERQEVIEPRMRAVLESFGKLFRLASGKKVLEVRPRVPCDKGTAVRTIARLADSQGKDLIIYIGDDETDEDAFAALKPKDIAIRVGEEAASKAAYFLRDTDEVVAFLDALVRWGIGEEKGRGKVARIPDKV